LNDPPFLAVWGIGPLEDVARQAITSDRVAGVVGGALSPEEVSLALRASDVVAVPSRTTAAWKEQFGRVAVEAMLSGAAVVASDSGSLPEVVGPGGVVISEGACDSLAEALDGLRDAQVRADTAAQGRAWALNRYEPDHVAADLVHFWRRVAESA
jgi:glycosyltransferase involved in cell wall biosynthesis